MKPCKECPFSRDIAPGNLGGSTPEVYGAAIMRANLGVKVPRALLSLSPSDEAFRSLSEFYAHHTGVSLSEAEQYLTPEKVRECALTEWNDSRVKMQLKKAS